MHVQLLQLRTTQVEGGLGYYAHVVALLVLYCLWRFPTAAAHKAPTNANKLEASVKPRLDPSSLLFLQKQQQNQVSKSSWSKEFKIQQAEEHLQRLYPSSTAAERRRFLLARSSDCTAAAKQLAGYLEWRERHHAIEAEHLDKNDTTTSIDWTDENDWHCAFEVARRSCHDTLSDGPVSRLARMYHHREDGSPVCDKDGYRIIHLMPAQLNPKLARPATYAMALALYLDRKLDRNSTELYTVMLDVRGGKTWANVHPYKLLPFIKCVTQLLLANFPERLYQCLLYPLPPAFLWLWNLARGVIDPMTASKIRLLSGPAKITSPPPLISMQESVAKPVVELLEGEREATFGVA